jgi:hypothetical protein
MRRHAEESLPAFQSKERCMPSNVTISADKLNRLIGTPNCPSLIDVRTDDEWAANPRDQQWLMPSNREGTGLPRAALPATMAAASSPSAHRGGLPQD